MAGLQEILQNFVDAGQLPGAVGLIDRGGRIEAAVAGSQTVGGTPMARDSIFRIASLTKPITAAAVMTLVDDGRIGLDDPVDPWLPELARPMVVRTPSSSPDDVIPANRSITVFDLLSSQAGYGFPSDFTLAAVERLFAVQKDGREVQSFLPIDEWMAALAEVPMLYQPGEAWLYDTCSTVQGILVARVTGKPLPDVLHDRLLEPLGMTDTDFVVPPDKRDRFTSYYRVGQDGALELADPPDGQWSRPASMPLASGGLTGTADDLLAFERMLLTGGVAADGRRVLSEDAVSRMTTDHTTAAQREIGRLFLDGQGWGFGGSVDIASREDWNVIGRYGWVGGTGTSAHIFGGGTAAILLTQVGAASPVTPEWMRAFWTYSATP